MDSTKTIIAVIAVAAVAIGAIALFGGSSKNEETTSSATATPMAQKSETIVDLAIATPDLSTLVTAVKAADLVGTLSDTSKEYTVFAPTNAAFAALPAGTLDTLLKPESKQQLTNVLTYHVVPSKALSSSLTNGQKLKTVQGQELTVRIDGGKVFINNAQVTTPDVKASNGVVHIINGVLLPS